jgi:hypothetical protein
MKHFKIYIQIIILLLLADTSYGSDSYFNSLDTNDRVLMLTHIKIGDSVFIRSHDFIQFKYEGNRIKGKIDSIGKSKIYISNKCYDIDKINTLKTEFTKGQFKKKGNSLIIIGIISLVGLEIWKNTYIYNNPENLLFFGNFITYQIFAAFFILLPGLFLRAVDFTYRYKLKKRWEIQSVKNSKVDL